MTRHVYDLETYPNAFTGCFKPIGQHQGVFFEISERRQDNQALFAYLHTLEEMVGFMNMGFDWPVLAYFIAHPDCSYLDLYAKSQEIINTRDRFTHVIWKPQIPQIDLYKIHHFDNKTKSTSLKALQVNMRSETVQDLPFPVGTHLSFPEIDVLLQYNAHDVLKTEEFYHKSAEKIAFRETLPAQWMNYNDGKIGKQFFIRELEGAGVDCFQRNPSTGKREPIQTPRDNGVRLADIILPYMAFATPELTHLLDALKATTVYDTKGAHDWQFTLGGLPCVMGCGGMHGSVDRKFFDGRGEREILDLDVTSFYPHIAFVNGLFPLHLGPMFCQVYRKLFDWRQTTPKGSSDNKALKLSLNVPFGESNSAFGPFFDPAYFLAITINGQLLVLSLAERLLCVPGLELIQINTDGVTVSFPREEAQWVSQIFLEWSAATQMPLETASYSRMWIRDVNNYVAEYVDPDKPLKLKGVYLSEREWHQDHSMLVIRQAAVAAMVFGTDPEEFIRNHDDPWDFLMRMKLGAGSRLLLDDGQVLHGMVRYYVSETGHAAIKRMPSTSQRIHAGGHASLIGEKRNYGCSLCDWTGKTKKAFKEHSEAAHASKIRPCNVYRGEPIEPDFRFYVAEARKIIIGAGSTADMAADAGWPIDCVELSPGAVEAD